MRGGMPACSARIRPIPSLPNDVDFSKNSKAHSTAKQGIPPSLHDPSAEREPGREQFRRTLEPFLIPYSYPLHLHFLSRPVSPWGMHPLHIRQ